MYDTELYDSFLLSQSSQYSFPEMTKTLIVCGALLLNNSGPFVQNSARVSLPGNKSGSDGYVINHLYSPNSPTWSDVETDTYSPREDTNNDIPEALNVLSNLTFIEGDAIAEKEADKFFDQIQIKTKKIMVTKKA